MVRHNKIISITKTMRETYRKRHLSCMPPKTKLFLQYSVIAAASQQTSPSAQQCSPIKEKQTGHFDFVNLTCKQHDRAKSPTYLPVSWGLFMCACGVCKRDSARQRVKFGAYICLCMQKCAGMEEKMKMCVSSK